MSPQPLLTSAAAGIAGAASPASARAGIDESGLAQDQIR